MTADDTALPGGPSYGDLLDAARRLNDALAWTMAPDDVVLNAARSVGAVADLLEGHVTPDEARAPATKRRDLPGRGHPGLIPIEVELDTQEATRGRVTFRPAHIGGRAVHGGMITLLFDDVMGILASKGKRPSRTAYLNVNYRNLTPIGVELQVEAWVDRIEGRKIFVRGRLHGADLVHAEAEGLFVMARDTGLSGESLATNASRSG